MPFKSITGRDPASGQSLTVNIEDGRIQSIAPAKAEEDLWLAPGFIDLQVNGYLGQDVNSASVTPETVVALTDKMLSTGVTTYLPTVITASEESIVRSLRAVAEAKRSNARVAHMAPFIHVEGPHIAPEDGPRGAHPRQHVRPPSLEEFDRWQAACGGLVGLVTLSPHWDNALEYISGLVKRGVLVAIGHSSAKAERVHEAAGAGATLSTHLGNGLGSPIPRHPNLLWAQLAEDRLTACFIADGHHLPFDTLKAMLRAKGICRSILVSDVVEQGGMPPGIYKTEVGDTVEVTVNESVLDASSERRYLAGAYRPLMRGVGHVAGIGGFSLQDAVEMATVNPGRFVGGRGRLQAGADADLVRFRWEPSRARIELESVLVRGEPVLR
jgi:N-acetylglucosamine-6-phosphate deacetylase